MTLALPAPLPDYFGATNAHDPDGVLASFAANASVHDEGHDASGRDAIRAWIVETMGKYRFTATPLAVDEKNGKTIVTVQVAGTFPGSPIPLSYWFTIANGKIAVLVIK